MQISVEEKLLIKQTIGNNLKKLRCEAGLTQEEIGDFIGITFQQVQKYEKGIDRLSGVDIYFLANFIGTKTNDFFQEMEEGHVNEADKELMQVMKELKKVKNPKIRKKIIDLSRAIVAGNEGLIINDGN